jgi:hypothetical protein
VKSDGPRCVKFGGPGFASATPKEGERTAEEQGVRPRAEEQLGKMTGGNENAREGLAKPG